MLLYKPYRVSEFWLASPPGASAPQRAMANLVLAGVLEHSRMWGGAAAVMGAEVSETRAAGFRSTMLWDGAAAAMGAEVSEATGAALGWAGLGWAGLGGFGRRSGVGRGPRCNASSSMSCRCCLLAKALRFPASSPAFIALAAAWLLPVSQVPSSAHRPLSPGACPAPLTLAAAWLLSVIRISLLCSPQVPALLLSHWLRACLDVGFKADLRKLTRQLSLHPATHHWWPMGYVEALLRAPQQQQHGGGGRQRALLVEQAVRGVRYGLAGPYALQTLLQLPGKEVPGKLDLYHRPGLVEVRGRARGGEGEC